MHGFAATHPTVPEDKHRQIMSTLIAALGDYSTDQRGDVGSWIRVVALKALRITLLALCDRHASSQGSVNGDASHSKERQQGDNRGVVSQDMFEDIIANMARLGVEKLEPVRAAAAFAWTGLREGGAAGVWEWEGAQAFGIPVGQANAGLTEEN